MADLLVELDPTAENTGTVLTYASLGDLVAHQAPPPPLNALYAGSVDTVGDAPVALKYGNGEIRDTLVVHGTSASDLETKLGSLSKKIGKIQREGGTYKRTSVTGSAVVFDLLPDSDGAVEWDVAHLVGNAASVELRFTRKPGWRGSEQSLGTFTETTLPVLTATVSPPANAYSVEVLADSPKMYLRLGESAGTNAADASGFNHPGTYVNSPSLGVAGAVAGSDTAVALNGTDEYVSVAHHADLAIVANLTFEAWVKPTDYANFAMLVVKGSADTPRPYEWRLNQTTGLPNLLVDTAATSQLGTTAPAIGVWSHVAVTLSGTTYTHYLNGAANGTGTFGGVRATDAGTALRVGTRDALNHFFKGSLDEVAVYNAALSAARMLAHYQAGVGGIKGSLLANGRAVITATQGDQWLTILGAQSAYYDAAATAALFYPATDFTPTGTSTKVAGATGAFGAGSNVVRNTDLVPTWQAVLRSEIDASNLALTHKGNFRVWARIYCPTGNSGTVSLKLEWALGDYKKTVTNDSDVVTFSVDYNGQWLFVDLGPVFLTPPSTGAHRWEFRLLAKSTVVGDELDTNYFVTFPTSALGDPPAYMEAGARLSFETPSLLSVRDEFGQTAGALTGKTLPVGGTWGNALGDVDDFNVDGAGLVTRAAVSDGFFGGGVLQGRAVAAGTTSLAAVGGQLDFKRDTTTVASGTVSQGLLLRYVDANNMLAAFIDTRSALQVWVYKVVAGTATAIVPGVTIGANSGDTWRTLRVVVDAAGRIFVWLFLRDRKPEAVRFAQDSVLATGGALATGKVAIFDGESSATATTRTYDNFFAFVPTPDAAVFATQSLQIRHDRAEREDSTGSFWGPISDPRGKFLRLSPGGQEGRSNRIVVKNCRGPAISQGIVLDPAVDDIALDLFATPQGVSVPEP